MRLQLETLEEKALAAVVAFNTGELTILKDGAERTVPALSGFDGEASVDTDGRTIAAGAGRGGGPAVQTLDMEGNPIAQFYAFPPEFMGGIEVAVADGSIWVAPAIGSGGGPILREYNLLGQLLSERMVGPADNRDGVALGGGNVTAFGAPAVTVPGNPADPTLPDQSGVPLDLSARGVRFIAGEEPTEQEWDRLRQSLSKLKPAAWNALIAAGQSIDIVKGVPLTTRPGLPPGTQGLYGPIDNLQGVGGPIVMRIDDVPDGSADAFLHEPLHQLLKLAGDVANSPGFRFIWDSTNWTSEYERTYIEEAAVESATRFLVGVAQPDPRLNGLFSTILGNLQWI